MPDESHDCGIVILAAGTSSRLGQPKQLLIFEGESLIKKIAEIALQITDKLVVVTGANAEQVNEELKNFPAHLVHNNFFTEGIASSIKAGLNALLERFKEVDSVIFMVCDQPFVSTGLIASLIKKKKDSGKTIIASKYAGTLGTPVLFQQKFFTELNTLKGDTGAKKIIYKYPDEVAFIDFPQGEVDVDTLEDYRSLLLKTKK